MDFAPYLVDVRRVPIVDGPHIYQVVLDKIHLRERLAAVVDRLENLGDRVLVAKDEKDEFEVVLQ